MTIRRIIDALDKEIQIHQAAIRRLGKRKEELIAAAAAAKRKEKPRGRQ